MGTGTRSGRSERGARGRLRRALALERDPGLRERMDDPHCDPVLLGRTYAQFAAVNRLISGWDRIFVRHLLDVARAAARERGEATLLDVGCGGGDLARRLAALAARAGVPLHVTGIDPDDRALAHARSRGAPSTLRWRHARAEDLVEERRRFDLVVSNHVLHHLDANATPAFLDVTARLARGRVVHGDIRRHPLALVGFALVSLPFRGSFIIGDGFRSIRRSYTPREAATLAPPPWRVVPMRPFRQLLILDAGTKEGEAR